MRKDPKDVVTEMVNQVGRHDARRLLVNEGISVSTAEKLVSGRYQPQVGYLITLAVMRAYEEAKLRAS